ncbi:MAG: hypothetical protein ACE5IK_06005 [Acidobacteriota bacterium]
MTDRSRTDDGTRWVRFVTRRTLVLSLALAIASIGLYLSRVQARPGRTSPGLSGDRTVSAVLDPGAGWFALIARLPELALESQQMARRRLGLTGPPAKVEVRLTGGRARSFAVHPQVARTVHGNRTRPWVIDLDLRSLRADTRRVATVLEHEMVHVSLGHAMGEEYGSLPVWLREGLAVHLAGEAMQKLDTAIASRPAESPLNLVRKLATTRHSAEDYPLDALAVEELLTLIGPDALPRLVSCLLDEKDWDRCRRQLTGLEAEPLESLILTHARQRVMERTGDSPRRFARGMRLLDEGRISEAAGVFDALVAAGEGPYRRESLLGRARCLAAAGRLQAARGQLEALLAGGELGWSLGHRVARFSVELAHRMGDAAAARRGCRRLALYGLAGGRPAECPAPAEEAGDRALLHSLRSALVAVRALIQISPDASSSRMR